MCEKGVEGFRATPEPLCLWKEHWTRGRWLGFKSQVCCEPVRELGQVTFFSSGLHFPTWKNEEHALHQHSSYLLLQSKNVQDIDWFEAFPKFHHFMACHEMGGQETGQGSVAGLLFHVVSSDIIQCHLAGGELVCRVQDMVPTCLVLWEGGRKAGLCWDCQLDSLCVASPVWCGQDDWTCPVAAKACKREFSKGWEVDASTLLRPGSSPWISTISITLCRTKQSPGLSEFKWGNIDPAPQWAQDQRFSSHF